MTIWTRWADARPQDPNLNYRWRVSPRKILGLELQPEWSQKLALVGMGYSDNEYWPSFSNWNGYERTVDPTLEWRVAGDDEKDIFWGGLDLLPSPFTGKMPVVSYSGRWVTAPPYLPESLTLSSWMIGFNSYTDAAKMRDNWNMRPEPTPAKAYAGVGTGGLEA